MVARRTEASEAWKARAACRGMSTELFFPAVPRLGDPIAEPVRRQIRQALDVCDDCPVWRECRMYAKYYDAREGIWGGVLFNRRGKPSNFQKMVG